MLLLTLIISMCGVKLTRTGQYQVYYASDAVRNGIA